MIDFKGAREWNGKETFVHIEGLSQEALYRTLSGKWYLELRSKSEGLPGIALTWRLIEEHEAQDWLERNGHKVEPHGDPEKRGPSIRF